MGYPAIQRPLVLRQVMQGILASGSVVLLPAGAAVPTGSARLPDHNTCFA